MVTGDRSTLYTAPEVQAILDEERLGTGLVIAIAFILGLCFGGLFGIWFATNLYGGH